MMRRHGAIGRKHIEKVEQVIAGSVSRGA